jgi:hypothetical protein
LVVGSGSILLLANADLVVLVGAAVDANRKSAPWRLKPPE